MNYKKNRHSIKRRLSLLVRDSAFLCNNMWMITSLHFLTIKPVSVNLTDQQKRVYLHCSIIRKFLNLSDALQDHLGDNGGADVGADEDDYTHQNDAPATFGEDIQVFADGNACISQDRSAELEEPYILNGRIDKIGAGEARIGQDTSESDHIGYAGDFPRKDAAHPHADKKRWR